MREDMERSFATKRSIMKAKSEQSTNDFLHFMLVIGIAGVGLLLLTGLALLAVFHG